MPRRTFSQGSPCPVCSGFNGAYRKDKRCKGWWTDDGVFCSVVPSSEYTEPWGLRLYLHRDKKGLTTTPHPPLQRSEDSLSNLVRESSGSRPSLCTAQYSNEESGRRWIAEEVTESLQQGYFRPAVTKKWYVVYEQNEEGKKEVTRSLDRQVAELYLPQAGY